MKLTIDDIDYSLPETDLVEHLSSHLAVMERSPEFRRQSETIELVRKTKNYLRNGIAPSQKQLRAVERIIKDILLVELVEKRIQEGYYGVNKFGFVTFGHESGIYSRIITKVTKRTNQPMPIRESDLHRFREYKYFDGRIDPKLKRFFREYAAEYMGSAAARAKLSVRETTETRLEVETDWLSLKYETAFTNLERICANI